ncbi:MAG: hypothetical protein R3E86_06585 [Pseudomonadales bacterium]
MTTQDEQTQMDRLGISMEHKAIYRFQGYRYERLADAISYAEKHAQNNAGRPAPGAPQGSHGSL